MRIEDTLIVKQTNDFCEDMRLKGFEVKKAYKCRGIIDNSIRNKLSKTGIPFQAVWYNKELKNVKKENIVIYETLITADFVKWIRKNNPDKRIVFLYLNIVKMSIDPESLKQNAEVYTWDKQDAQKYGLKMYKGTYWAKKVPKLQKKKYDVLFIGRDKGRFEELRELEHRLNDMGLVTYFHIVADRPYQKEKDGYRYKNIISYQQLLELTLQSRAVLDMVQAGQVGYTLRTMESIFYGIKLVTNNKSIQGYDFYEKENIFILGEEDIGLMKAFLDKPLKPVDRKILQSYTFESLINNL